MKVFLIAGCAAALLFFSGAASDACRTAAQVFALGVMPSLFPMMVLSRLLPPAQGRAAGVQAVLFGWLAGSPASAQRAACSGRCSERLLCLTGVMSPMFFTGTLASWLGTDGWRMLAVHWLGAAATALLWPDGRREQQALPDVQPLTLPSAIGRSASAMLSVCGAMMLFSAAAGVLKQLLPLPHQAHAVLHALLEIGSGAKEVAGAFAQPPCALLCALCSFGGLSLWLQNLLFLDQKIRPAKLLLMRALHGAVSYGLYGLISFL